MSKEFNLTTSDGNKYYFPETKTPLRNETWVTESQWETVFNAIDNKDKGNRQISQKEISLFLEDVEEASGENKILEFEELKKLASKYETSTSNMTKAISALSGILVANNIDSKFVSWFNSPMDLEGAEKAIKEQVNSGNIVAILGHKPNLPQKIIDNFEQSKAMELLDKIYEALKATAERNDLKIEYQIEEYVSAKENNDLHKMQKVITSIVQYFRNDYEIDVTIENYKPIHTVYRAKLPPIKTEKPIEITPNNYKDLANVARSYGITDGNDLVGDGVLGNSKSIATTSMGQLIMDSLTELLQDNEFNEKFLSCYRKENHKLVLYWPKDNRNFCSTENGLIEQNQVGNGTIGDGDMTLVVAAVIKRLEKEGKSINNKEEMKQYLLEKFM